MQRWWRRLLSTWCSASSDSHHTNLAIKSQRKEGFLCKSNSARHALKNWDFYTPRNTAEGNIIQLLSFSGYRALCKRAALWRKRLVLSTCTLIARSHDTSQSIIRHRLQRNFVEKMWICALYSQACRNRRWFAKDWTITRWSRTATAILMENHQRTRGPVTWNHVHPSEYSTHDKERFILCSFRRSAVITGRLYSKRHQGFPDSAKQFLHKKIFQLFHLVISRDLSSLQNSKPFVPHLLLQKTLKPKQQHDLFLHLWTILDINPCQKHNARRQKWRSKVWKGPTCVELDQRIRFAKSHNGLCSHSELSQLCRVFVPVEEELNLNWDRHHW